MTASLASWCGHSPGPRDLRPRPRGLSLQVRANQGWHVSKLLRKQPQELKLTYLSPPAGDHTWGLPKKAFTYLKISFFQYFFPPSQEKSSAHVQVKIGEALGF